MEAKSQRNKVIRWYESEKEALYQEEFIESNKVSLQITDRGIQHSAQADGLKLGVEKKYEKLHQQLDNEKEQRLSDIDEWEAIQIRYIVEVSGY